MLTAVSNSAARAVLVLVLLATWQGALLHPLQHLDVQGQFVHLRGVSPSDDKQPSSDSSQLCDALAALAACTGVARAAFADPSSGFVGFSDLAGVPPTASFPPFRAQAPPLLPKLS